MKQCPRCKSQLMKTHSEKFVCRACGYMTVILFLHSKNLKSLVKINNSNNITIIVKKYQQIVQQFNNLINKIINVTILFYYRI